MTQHNLTGTLSSIHLYLYVCIVMELNANLPQFIFCGMNTLYPSQLQCLCQFEVSYLSKEPLWLDRHVQILTVSPIRFLKITSSELLHKLWTLTVCQNMSFRTQYYLFGWKTVSLDLFGCDTSLWKAEQLSRLSFFFIQNQNVLSHGLNRNCCENGNLKKTAGCSCSILATLEVVPICSWTQEESVHWCLHFSHLTISSCRLVHWWKHVGCLVRLLWFVCEVVSLCALYLHSLWSHKLSTILFYSLYNCVGEVSESPESMKEPIRDHKETDQMVIFVFLLLRWRENVAWPTWWLMLSILSLPRNQTVFWVNISKTRTDENNVVPSECEGPSSCSGRHLIQTVHDVLN